MAGSGKQGGGGPKFPPMFTGKSPKPTPRPKIKNLLPLPPKRRSK